MPISTDTLDGVSAGMCPWLPQHEMGDQCAWYLQDTLLHKKGEVIRRGPVSVVSGAASSFAERQVATFQTIDPQGQVRIGVLGSTTNLRVLDVNGALLGTLTWPDTLTTSPYTIVDAKPALGGGTWIGAFSNYGTGSSQWLALWKGAYAADYSTGTIAASGVTQGSTSVTGSGTTWTVGMQGAHLFDGSGKYVGTVAKFNSATSLTLEQGALYSISSAAYSLKALRGWEHRVGGGTITVTSGTTTVLGSNTKFVSEGLQSGTWDLFRAADNVKIGSITGSTTNVPNNYGATLSGNAAIGMNNEPYYAIKQGEDMSIKQAPAAGSRGVGNSVGAITAVWNQAQWFANNPVPTGVYGDYGTRIWESTTFSPEAVDLSPVDGSFLILPSTMGVSTNITGMMPTNSGLLVTNENETFLVVGTEMANYTPKKILDDGAPCGMSLIPYAGGAIWAGKNGIYFFDGSTVHNIVEDRLGDYWKRTVKNFDSTTYRMYAFLWRDHYFLHVENCASDIAVVKGNASTSSTRMTFGIYLPTRAVSTYSNMLHRGAVRPSGTNKCFFLVNDNGGLGRLCDGITLLDTEGNDTVTCENATAGPDLYIETRKYTLNDSARLKVFRQLILNYYLTGDVLKLDLVPGLNTVGANVVTTWDSSNPTWDLLPNTYPTWDALAAGVTTWDSLSGAIWKVKKIQFQNTSQMVSLRLYQASSNVTAARLASWQLGFKLRRAGAT